MKFKFLMICCFLLVGLSLFAKESEMKTKLYSAPFDSGAKHYIYVKGWDSNFEGFDIEKKVGDKWVSIVRSPIRPSISKTKDYAALGYKGDLKVFEPYLALQGVKEMTADEMQVYLAEKNGLLGGDRIKMGQDFHFALFLGFGCVESDAEIGTSYKLFRMVSGEKILCDETILRDFSQVDLTDKIVTKLSQNAVNKSSAKMELEISLDIINEYDLIGYQLYKKLGDEITPILEGDSIRWIGTSKDLKSFQYISGNFDALILKLIHAMKVPYQEINIKNEIPQEPAKKPILEIADLIDEDGILTIQTELKNADVDAVKSFDVEILNRNNNEVLYKKSISKHVAKLEVPIKIDRKVSNALKVALTVVLENGAKINGHKTIITNKEMTKPYQIENVKAEVICRGEDYFLIFKWDVVPAKDREPFKFIGLYRESDGPHKWIQSGYIKIDKIFEKNIYISKDETLSFKLQPQTDAGQKGEPVFIKIPVFKTRMPFFINRKIVDKDGAYKLVWELKEQEEALKGFRVYCDIDGVKTLLHNEPILSADVNEIVIPDSLKPRTYYNFYFEAINHYGAVGSDATSNLQYNKRKEFLPLNVTGEKLENGDIKVLMKWSKAEGIEIRGYLFSNDTLKTGDFKETYVSSRNKILDTYELTFTPKDDRKTYTFGVKEQLMGVDVQFVGPNKARYEGPKYRNYFEGILRLE